MRRVSNALSPKKLVLSKWTAVAPLGKDKHFLVTRVIEPVPPEGPIVSVEIEAVFSRRLQVIAWRQLTDPSQWRRGWL